MSLATATEVQAATCTAEAQTASDLRYDQRTYYFGSPDGWKNFGVWRAGYPVATGFGGLNEIVVSAASTRNDGDAAGERQFLAQQLRALADQLDKGEVA